METEKWVIVLIFMIFISAIPFSTKETVCYYETFQEQEEVSSDILSYEENHQIIPPKDVVAFKVINRDIDTGGVFIVKAIFSSPVDIKFQAIPVMNIASINIKLNEYINTGSAYIPPNSEGTVLVEFSGHVEASVYKVSKYELIKPRKIATRIKRHTRLEEVTFSVLQRIDLL